MTSDQAVVATLRSQRIELPSWAFGNSGTRFKVFAQQGVPRDPYEKVSDAAQVHRYTGVAPTVALHIPWDRVDDYADLARHADAERRRARDDQLERLPGRRLHARQRLQPGSAHPPQGARPPARLRRRHGRHRLARPEAVVLGRDELSRSGRHPRPPGSAGRSARGRPRATRDRTSGWCSSTSSSSRRSTRWTCRTGGRPTCSAWPPGPKASVVVDTGHHAPGHQHRVHRRVAAAGRAPRRLRLQLALLRGRRPDGRARRTRSSCSGSCTRSSRPAASTRPSAWRSCWTSATTSNPRSRPRSGPS